MYYEWVGQKRKLRRNELLGSCVKVCPGGEGSRWEGIFRGESRHALSMSRSAASTQSTEACRRQPDDKRLLAIGSPR